MHYFLAAFSGNPLPKVTWWHSGVIFDSTDEIPRSRGGSIIGQAHDMFSRIFSIRFYEFFLRNIVWFFFSQMLKVENKISRYLPLTLLWPTKKYYWLLKKIGDSFSKNSWKHVMSSIIVNRMVYKSLTREDLFKVFVCQASNTNRTLPVSRKVKVVLNCKYLFPNPAKSWAKLGKKPPVIDFF